MKKTGMLLRRLLFCIFTNPCVFVFVAYMVSGMFMMGKLGEYRGIIELNVIIPWGLALALLRLYRAAEQSRALRADVLSLCALILWLVVPFAFRFGPTAANIDTWRNHVIIFFGVFALIAEENPARLEKQLNLAGVLFSAVSAVYAGSLLYCAVTVQNLLPDPYGFGFGLFQNAQLCAAQHYNGTGMMAMCGAFVCLFSAVRCRNRLGRVLHLIPSVMMMLVVVLTQSRTARYSLLAGLAVGAYGVVAAYRWNRYVLVRHVAGFLAAAVTLAGGYMLASGMTDAALRHYAQGESVQLVASAQAEAPAQETEQKAEAEPVQARGAGEGTFTGRTDIWKNIFSMWREKPKYFLIGNGVGRTSRDILIGTPLEHGGANMAHNAYIQFTMDQGLIGFTLLCIFFATLLLPALRVLLAAPGRAMAGGRVMCMLTIACMLTGMMENEPLSAMRPCSAILFFALALIAHAGTRKNMKR